MCLYTCIRIYIHIYIERERERERDINIYICVYVHVYANKYLWSLRFVRVLLCLQWWWCFKSLYCVGGFQSTWSLAMESAAVYYIYMRAYTGIFIHEYAFTQIHDDDTYDKSNAQIHI